MVSISPFLLLLASSPHLCLYVGFGLTWEVLPFIIWTPLQESSVLHTHRFPMCLPSYAMSHSAGCSFLPLALKIDLFKEHFVITGVRSSLRSFHIRSKSFDNVAMINDYFLSELWRFHTWAFISYIGSTSTLVLHLLVQLSDSNNCCWVAFWGVT